MKFLGKFGKSGLAAVSRQAANHGYSSLALAGKDVETLIDHETDPVSLKETTVFAQRHFERIWAERAARRLVEIEDSDENVLKLASLLAHSGDLEEAGRFLSGVSTGKTVDPLFHETRAILDAKAGRLEEAMAQFDRLPGKVDGYHPAPIVFRVVEEMFAQCRASHVSGLTERLHELFPDHLVIRGMLLRSRFWNGDRESAAELSHVPYEELETAPEYDRRSLVQAVAALYTHSGWMQEQFDYCRRALAGDPSHWGLYGDASVAASLTSRRAEYGELVSAIPDALGRAPEGIAVLCRWHADEGRLDEAEKLLDHLKTRSAPLFLNLRLYIAVNHLDAENVEAAYRSCVDCGIDRFGPALGYGLYKFHNGQSDGRFGECLQLLDEYRSGAATNSLFWQLYLRCLLGQGQSRAAVAKYGALSKGLRSDVKLKPFEMCFDAQAGNHDRAREGWSDFIRSSRHPCINARSSYPACLDLKYRERDGAILLFSTVFDGADYLDWFLPHYRSLGVDHFFFTDNGSTDGTRETLLAEPDVSLFSNSGSFGASAFGVLWINHLMQRYGVGHWCLHVDIDEGLVFPGQHMQRTLRDLTAYCAEQGYDAVRATMVDMYPENLDGQPVGDPFAQSCYFDNDYFDTPWELPPYVYTQGGIRRRMTGLALAMQKMPLIRVGPGVRYIDCNHHATHLSVADVTGALLHYKFVGDIKRKTEDAISRGEHSGGAISYQRLAQAAGDSGWQGSLLTDQSQVYENTSSLEAHGIIRSSAAWKGFSAGCDRNSTPGAECPVGAD